MFKISFVEFSTPQTMKSALSSEVNNKNNNSPKKRGRPPKKKQQESNSKVVTSSETMKDAQKNVVNHPAVILTECKKRKLENVCEQYRTPPLVVSPPSLHIEDSNTQATTTTTLARNRKIIRTSISLKEILN